MKPTLSRVKELIRYDPNTGMFVWLKNLKGGVRAGDIAGANPGDQGYGKIRIDNSLMLAHRLAFCYMTEEWPSQVDHINRDKMDNRWGNLRLATFEINAQNRSAQSVNNVTGLLGVRVNRKSKKNPFVAQITVDCKNRHLGCYPTAKAAHEAYLNAKRTLHEGCTI